MNALNEILNSNVLNPTQRASVEYFLKQVLWDGRYEIKTGHVSHLYDTKGGTTFAMTLDIGMPDDTGTWAEVLCRDHWHLFIGPRGKLTAKTAPKHRKQFKGRTALGVFHAPDCGFYN